MAGSHASPLVWRARRTNVLCLLDAVVPTRVVASSNASSTASTWWAWRCSRNASGSRPTPIRLATSAKTDVPSVAAMPCSTTSAAAGLSDDRQQSQRLEIDEHVPAVVIDAELGERDAGRADGSGRIGEQLDRRGTGQGPPSAPALPRRAEDGVGGERQFDRAVATDPHDRDLRLALDAALRPQHGLPRRRAPTRSPASMARNRRSVATVSGGGSGTRARGWEPRSLSRRRAATSASTPADRSAASPTPIGDADPGHRGGVASAGPGSTGGGTGWRSVVVVASAGAATSAGASGAGPTVAGARRAGIPVAAVGSGPARRQPGRQPLPPRVVLAACRWRGS